MPRVSEKLAAHPEVVASYTGEALLSKQQTQLKTDLLQHGFTEAESFANSRQALENLSARNLSRLLAPHRTSKPSAEVWSLTETLFLRFKHSKSSRWPVHKNAGVLLSAQELAHWGLAHGVHTGPFNADVLKSAGNVFFTVDFSNGARDFSPQQTTEWGDQAFLLNPDYAEKQAWISFWVMHASDLNHFAKNELAAEAQGKPIGSWEALAGFSEAVAEQQKIIRQLHRSDFTVADFTTLFRTATALYLENLKRFRPALYEKERDAIGQGKAEVAFRAFQFLKLGMNWELKVPVAVPVSQLIPLKN